MGKPIIAVDVDDVLATSVPAWVAYSNKRWGTKLTVDDYDEDWAKMWQIDHEEAAKRATELNTSGIVADFEHFGDAKEVLTTLAKKYKLVIASSRVEHQREATLQWLDERFGGIFDEIHFGGFYDKWRPDSVNHTKAGMLQTIGASYLIDDQPKHCFAAAEAGIEALLFGDYAWSRNLKELPAKVTKCRNWLDVGEYFEKLR